MAEVRAVAEVLLWGRTVGAVAELESGRIFFEYDPEFRESGLEVSPIHLPLEREGSLYFDELLRKDAFRGLPGLLADALPDAFGNRVIRAWFEARGEAERLGPVQRLLYVGERAMGALTFRPAEPIPTRPAEEVPLELAALVRDARRIVEGVPEVAVPEIYRIGSSAGGMRPKAVVLHDPASDEIRSAYAPRREGDVPCILKFDGVAGGPPGGPPDGELGAPAPFNRIEAAYSDLARACGVEIPHLGLLEHDGYAHLLVPRFDLEGELRLHQHTFGGLVHVDYNEPGASSYEEYLRTALRLGMTQDSIEQGFLRMVFNVLAVNQDDHVKNLSFHMDPEGVWSLTPAYDLTFARGEGFTRRHQMRVHDRTEGFRSADLLAVAELFGIRRAARVIERVEEALAGWEPAAEERGVPPDAIAFVRSELDRRAAELAAD